MDASSIGDVLLSINSESIHGMSHTMLASKFNQLTSKLRSVMYSMKRNIYYSLAICYVVGCLGCFLLLHKFNFCEESVEILFYVCIQNNAYILLSDDSSCTTLL